MNQRIHPFSDFRATTQALIVALLATLMVASTPVASSAAINHGAIAYNSGTCELTTAGYSGDGSQGDPYQISDSESLWEVADCSWNGSPLHFSLIEDINVSGSTAPTTSPIGFSTSGNIISFRGVLSGPSTIHGIKMHSSTQDVALFSKLDNATISDLVVAGDFLTSGSGKRAAVLAIDSTGLTRIASVRVPDYLGPASVSGQAVSGGLVATAEQIVLEDVHVKADVETRQGGGGLIGQGLQVTVLSSTYDATVWGRAQNVSSMLGGLVGEVVTQSGPNPPSLVVQNSSNLGIVIGHDDVGGLVGKIRGISTISDSVNEGRVHGNGNTFGGLIGDALDSIQLFIDNSQNLGQVEVGESQAGGLIGAAQGNVRVIDSINYGEVVIGATGNYSAGGLLGLSSPNGPAGSTLRVSGFINDGTVSAPVARAGGIVGFNQIPTEITNSVNRGLIYSKDFVGGLVGLSTQPLTLSQVVNSGSISGSSSVASGAFGGLAGSVSAVVGTALSNTGDVAGGAESKNVGGLFGSAASIELVGATNSGRVSGLENVGGLAGRSTQFSISNAVNTATVSANSSTNSHVGGLIGWSHVSDVSNSQNSGTVLGATHFVGGLIGWAQSDARISFSGNYGAVSGGANSAGLIARANSAHIISSHNSGPISGRGGQTAGIVSYAQSRLTISSSVNSGSVEGFGTYVAGLVSYAFNEVTINSSYNAGNISGSDVVSGLVIPISTTSLNTVYNSGSISSGNEFDGLVAPVAGSGANVSTNSVYTSIASNFAPTSTVAELRAPGTYTGWDFNTVWGFGTCSENNGLPSLRVLGLFANYYSDGCYTAPLSNAGSGGAPAAVYVGPIITSMSSEVVAGQLLEVEGRRLDSVATVSIAGLLQEIVSKSATTLVVLVSASTTVGVADLILESSFGTLTVQQALKVLEPKITHPLVGKTKMLAASKLAAENWIANNLSDSGLKRVVCTVTVASDATRAERVLARKSAKASCLAVSGYLDDASVWFQTRVTAHQKLVGRTMLTFRG